MTESESRGAARIRIEVGRRPSDPDLAIADYDSIDALVEDFQDIAADASAGVDLLVDLAPGAHRSFSITDAFAAMVEILSAAERVDVHLHGVVPSDTVRQHLDSYLPEAQRKSVSLRIGQLVVRIRSGDIARTRADAIVNASNTQLKLGGGVSGAIRRAARDADALQAAMSALAPIGHGDVVVTASHGLPKTDKVLHVATASGREEAVQRAVAGILSTCERLKIGHVAIPALGAGTGGMSLERCAEITQAEISRFAERNPAFPRQVDLVLHGGRATESFIEVFRRQMQAPRSLNGASASARVRSPDNS